MKTMKLYSSAYAVLMASSICALAFVSAFAPSVEFISPAVTTSTPTQVFVASLQSDDLLDRRAMLKTTAAAIVAGFATSAVVRPPEAAGASYSTYASREKDWAQREKLGGECMCICIRSKISILNTCK